MVAPPTKDGSGAAQIRHNHRLPEQLLIRESRCAPTKGTPLSPLSRALWGWARKIAKRPIMLASAGRRVKRPVKVGKSPPPPLFSKGGASFSRPLFSKGGRFVFPPRFQRRMLGPRSPSSREDCISRPAVSAGQLGSRGPHLRREWQIRPDFSCDENSRSPPLAHNRAAIPSTGPAIPPFTKGGLGGISSTQDPGDHA